MQGFHASLGARHPVDAEASAAPAPTSNTATIVTTQPSFSDSHPPLQARVASVAQPHLPSAPPLMSTAVYCVAPAAFPSFARHFLGAICDSDA
jgi:hypothetical protein